MFTRIFRSAQDREQFYTQLKLTPCPHCKSVGMLIKHGYLRGYDIDHQTQTTVRAARVFCSNRNQASGCGRTFSLWVAHKIKRLFLDANSLWTFLTEASDSGNKLQAFRKLNCGLSDSAPYRIWKRFQLAQSAIRTSLISICQGPTIDTAHCAQLTLAHLRKAFPKDRSPIAAIQQARQTFFI